MPLNTVQPKDKIRAEDHNSLVNALKGSSSSEGFDVGGSGSTFWSYGGVDASPKGDQTFKSLFQVKKAKCWKRKTVDEWLHTDHEGLLVDIGPSLYSLKSAVTYGNELPEEVLAVLRSDSNKLDFKLDENSWEDSQGNQTSWLDTGLDSSCPWLGVYLFQSKTFTEDGEDKSKRCFYAVISDVTSEGALKQRVKALVEAEEETVTLQLMATVPLIAEGPEHTSLETGIQVHTGAIMAPKSAQISVDSDIQAANVRSIELDTFQFQDSEERVTTEDAYSLWKFQDAGHKSMQEVIAATKPPEYGDQKRADVLVRLGRTYSGLSTQTDLEYVSFDDFVLSADSEWPPYGCKSVVRVKPSGAASQALALKGFKSERELSTFPSNGSILVRAGSSTKELVYCAPESLSSVISGGGGEPLQTDSELMPGVQRSLEKIQSSSGKEAYAVYNFSDGPAYPFSTFKDDDAFLVRGNVNGVKQMRYAQVKDLKEQISACLSVDSEVWPSTHESLEQQPWTKAGKTQHAPALFGFSWLPSDAFRSTYIGPNDAILYRHVDALGTGQQLRYFKLQDLKDEIGSVPSLSGITGTFGFLTDLRYDAETGQLQTKSLSVTFDKGLAKTAVQGGWTKKVQATPISQIYH